MANEERKVSKVEIIKDESNYLRGTIAEALQDDTTHFSEDNIQVLKFHGMYQQDDRDLRKELKKEGKERHYMMMIRARIPGGVLSADQYLAFDNLSEEYGNHTMRITTRQTFQLHGILKRDIKATLRSINEALITTLGGCGDQVRNIIGCAAPHEGRFYEQVREDLLALVDRLGAKTSAYHEIWLDGEKVDLSEPMSDNPEPLYGKTYLPRKFKLAFAYEGDNCSDVYANDIGLVAHRQGDAVEGYTLLVGGGMGRTASDAETRPVMAKPLCFVPRDAVVDVCEAIVKVQRDHGNREERKFARMKYLIESRGLDWFKQHVEAYFGGPLAAPRDLIWESAQDHLGWHAQSNGRGWLGIFTENGRIHDTDTMKLKSVLRDIMTTYRPTVHLTTQQNILLCDLTEQHRVEIEARLQEAGVPLVETLSEALLGSMACPAMPTCGLAIAESERALPSVIRQFEALLGELGLTEQEISIRMTGCPNGCARPYIAEIGFVGRVIGKYDLFLGANLVGSRMNELFKEQVPVDSLVSTVRPLLESYVKARQTAESFGDYCYRVGFDYLRNLEPVSAQ